METQERTGYYNKCSYIHLIMEDKEFIIDKEISAVYEVIPDDDYAYEEKIEFTTDHDERAEVYGVVNKLSINQLKEQFELGGIL